MATHPHNLIRNGSFEEWNGGTTDSAPDYWSNIGTPEQVSRDTGDYDNFGNPYAVKIESNGAGHEGIQYTLTKLKSGVTYTVCARVKVTAADTAKMWTSGETSDLSVTSTSTAWADITGTFQPSGTEVTLKIGSDNDTDIVWFDSLIVIEGSTTYAFAPHPLDTVVEASKDINPVNLLRNGSFEAWSNGTPYGWVIESGTITKLPSIGTRKFGDYVVSLESGPTTTAEIRQAAPTEINTQVTVSCFVICSTANSAKVGISAGGPHVYSKYHSGSGTAELLTATITPTSPSTIGVYLEVESGSKTAFFDGACLMLGDTPFIFTPNPLDTGGEVYGNLTFKGGKSIKGLGESGSTDKYPLVWDNANSKYKADKLDGSVLGGTHDGTVHDPSSSLASQETDTDAYDLLDNAARTYLAQTIGAPPTKEITKVVLKLLRTGTIASGKKVWVEIWDANTGGSPTTPMSGATSGKIVANDIATTKTDYAFILPKGIRLLSSQSYTIVLRGDYDVTGSYISWRYNTAGGYIYGEAYRGNATPTWSEYTGDDFYFKAYYGEQNAFPLDQLPLGAGSLPSTSAGVPSGGIIIWHGAIADIPDGFVICDNNNGTPNLLAKFVKGVATAATAPGATGGEATHTLVMDEIPSHEHAIVQPNAGGTWAWAPTVQQTTNVPLSQGNDEPHENLPPYYDVAFIMKT